MMCSHGHMEREILECSYLDIADVYRHDTIKDEATKQTSSSWQIHLQGVHCALSQERSSQHSVRDGVGEASSSYVLFCPPDSDIAAGDRVIVTIQSGKQYETRAGQAFWYLSHMEVPLKGKLRV